ncbi:MAG TPA: TldD/PmbA family protein [Acholeplasmataceae bacterium]|nr:TldD/PmbA family protein [Acholeplasmataceae bacterium]
MLKNKELKKILEVCLETGGDFAELYFEDTIKNNYELTSGKVTRINTSNLYGVSIRILKGAEESFGYTSDISFESLMNLAKKLNASLNYPKEEINFELKEIKAPVVNLPVILPSSLSNNEKIKYLELLNKGIFTYESEEINQVICVLSDEEQKITVVNTLGKIVKDLRTHIRLAANVIAKSENIMQTAFDSIAGNQGYEIFNGFNYNEFGYEIAKTAINMLHADEMIGGNMDVVLHNGFGGVLLHEACVHSLEATSVAKGNSVFCNKLGQKIASDIVTAVDDGTIPNGWGSLNIDDEGNETKRNVLIKDGVLQTYLVDYRNSKIMNHPITGSGRRQSYKYSPTSRMTNTFFTPGTSSFEEIIASTKFGLFAKRMGGGSVNPTTGEFNFSVNEGYMIENGEITKPVRGATLVGSGAHILKNIDMIANNLEFSFGMCGSQSGSIPTIVGQPTVRVLNLTVGGRGEK